MKFDVNQLLRNQIYFEREMGSCETECHNADIWFVLPLGYKVCLTAKGLYPFYNGNKMSTEPFAILDDAFNVIRKHLNSRLDELMKIPCLQN